jgi:ATP-dependent 26S proteasome regulatory subunit
VEVVVPSKVDHELETLIRARYPIIYIVSWEEKRVEDALRAITTARGKRMFVWTVTQGMVVSPTATDERTRMPLAALDFVINSNDPAVFVLKDFHAFIADTEIARRLRDLTYALKTSYKTLVILSPTLKLPPELEKEVTVVDYVLPTLEDLDRLLENIIQSVKSNPQIDTDLEPAEREHILDAALGLTASEAENVFARSLVEKRTFDVNVILSEKEQIIRKSGMLEYYRAGEGFADVGGLDVLKDWMRKRTQAFGQKAREFGLPAPKGILLLGVQGCGKSLSCKAVASQWRLPLLRLDVGKIFSGIVGSSEENIRRAIRTAESIAPTILWLDELEKGFAGTQSSPFSDAGTTSRVFASFITWLQEKTAPVFVVATANRIEELPPELLRKGRFDEIFFVDLPALAERREILDIHIRKRKRDPAQFDLEHLADASEGFSGAEIEQAIVSALYDAFDAGHDLTTGDILRNVRDSVPLSRMMREQIDTLRDWAVTRARRASSHVAENGSAGRSAGEVDGGEELGPGSSRAVADTLAGEVPEPSANA